MLLKHGLQLASCRLTTKLVWARLMAEGKAAGRPRSVLDMIIAAVSETHGFLVVTDNEKDFSSRNQNLQPVAAIGITRHSVMNFEQTQRSNWGILLRYFWGVFT